MRGYTLIAAIFTGELDARRFQSCLMASFLAAVSDVSLSVYGVAMIFAYNE